MEQLQSELKTLKDSQILEKTKREQCEEELRAKETRVKEAEVLAATIQSEYNEVNQKLNSHISKET